MGGTKVRSSKREGAICLGRCDDAWPNRKGRIAILTFHSIEDRVVKHFFKDSVLPFKDPSTLNMFLKEINEFNYSHSEKLGDAFEYLLSFMGSQGDAGQFRTPRHIIDFIVEIVNPQKNETILDPACGTAGFLISSYKHILKPNLTLDGIRLIYKDNNEKL